jgi:Fur family ferric uptake transcriptional regulator
MVSPGPERGASLSADSIFEALRTRGLRVTPQRRAILKEVLEAEGHISPSEVVRRLQRVMPGVNPSTVYRTLAVLEETGVLAHAHMETGPEYHRRGEAEHVHLVCSSCGAEDALSIEEAGLLEGLVRKHHGFQPDLTHFAISGLCRDCQPKRGS